MSMKKNEENKAEVLKMYFEEKKSSNEIVDIIVSEAENNVTDTVATPSNSEGITW